MKKALVVTTISEPTEGMLRLAYGASANDIDFYVIGDTKTPDFSLLGARYYSLEDQYKTKSALAQVAPKNSYTRKNIGYLLAMRSRADVIQETDDDNIPYPEFWDSREQRGPSEVVDSSGWVNAYSYFTNDRIWPRGLPLDEIDSYRNTRAGFSNSPIQQGLADDDPDVDAIYRLTAAGLENGGSVFFDSGLSISLNSYVWCPFNSQNTTWFRGAFPLMYLPSTCTFRMTDIWRSFVAQRILWTNNQSVLFHAPTVVQKRNAHNLMDDFAQEVPGYLNNRKIAESLSSLKLERGFENIPANMRRCYNLLIEDGYLKEDEWDLLNLWLKDIKGAL